jgi:hypothetical protein
MASTVNMEKIAHYTFMAFVLIAIVAGLAIGAWAYSVQNNYYSYAPFSSAIVGNDVANANSYVLLIMLILGLIVGLISVTAKEVQPFLMATIALIAASLANVWAPLADIHAILPYWATAILNYIVAFVAPAAVILAIKAVFAMERSK